MALFIYGVAANTGKDGDDYVDVWVIGSNERGACWLADKNGTEKTKSEAQTLVTAAVTAAQNEWDGLSDEQKAIRGPRPTAISIP